MINLYPHQDSVIGEARQALRRHNSVLIQAPTGFGKTVLASFMAQSATSKGLRVWFVCHRAELVFQTAKTFDGVGIKYGYIAAGYPENPAAPVQICSIDTLKNRVNRLTQPGLVIWDEAHHVAAAGWSKVMGALSRAKHVGLSATPQRLDGAGLSDHFGHMVLGPSVSWLIENGYLSDYKVYAPSAPDLSGVHTRYGDYKKSELDEAMDKPSLTGDIIAHWKKYARGKKTICFAVSVKHSEHIAEQFRAAGVMAVHLDGKTPKAERKAACQAFASGDIDVLCNVDLFGEGFDVAAQAGRDVTVEAVIQARPTQSLALHLQQVGRALRRKNYPAIILDHAGNCMKHGLPDDEREWSLDSQKRTGKKSDSEQLTPIKQCPTCFHAHRPAPACPSCGHVYEVVGRKIEEREGELIELDKEAVRRSARKEQGQATSLDSLIELGRKRGYKNPHAWAAHVFTARKRKRA